MKSLLFMVGMVGIAAHVYKEYNDVTGLVIVIFIILSSYFVDYVERTFLQEGN